MKKSAWIVSIVVALLIVLVIGLTLVPTTTLEVPSSATHSFTIDESMPRVRKILVRTNAVKKIVAMADAELLDQKWLQMQFEIERPLLDRDWQVNGEGELIVETNDGYIGRHEITLKQTIDIKPDRLYVTNVLAKPVGPILEYSATLTLTTDENGKAHFENTVQLKIRTTASWIASGLVENSIRSSALKSLKQQEKAILELVERHADELFILPDTGDDQ